MFRGSRTMLRGCHPKNFFRAHGAPPTDHAPRLPLEDLLRPGAPVPNRRQPANLEDRDDFVERELERRQRFPGWYLGDPRLTNALLALEHDEGRVALPLGPPFQLDAAPILDVVAAMDWKSGRLHPQEVRG